MSKKLCRKTNLVDQLASIAMDTYLSLLENMNDPPFFQNRVILALKKIVDMLNDYLMSLVPIEEKTYLSFNSPCTMNGNIDRPKDDILLSFF